MAHNDEEVYGKQFRFEESLVSIENRRPSAKLK